MLPRLQAEESSSTADCLAVGIGSVPEATQRRVRDEWHRQSLGARRIRAQRKRATSKADLMALGIEVIVEPPRGH